MRKYTARLFLCATLNFFSVCVSFSSTTKKNYWLNCRRFFVNTIAAVWARMLCTRLFVCFVHIHFCLLTKWDDENNKKTYHSFLVYSSVVVFGMKSRWRRVEEKKETREKKRSNCFQFSHLTIWLLVGVSHVVA